jgi:hypothetical protein
VRWNPSKRNGSSQVETLQDQTIQCRALLSIQTCLVKDLFHAYLRKPSGCHSGLLNLRGAHLLSRLLWTLCSSTNLWMEVYSTPLKQESLISKARDNKRSHSSRRTRNPLRKLHWLISSSHILIFSQLTKTNQSVLFPYQSTRGSSLNSISASRQNTAPPRASNSRERWIRSMRARTRCPSHAS